MADITLADYTGYIFLELIKAREMADRYSRTVAEAYAQDPVMQYFSVPRFKVPKMELAIPVLVSGARFNQVLVFRMPRERFAAFVIGRLAQIVAELRPVRVGPVLVPPILRPPPVLQPRASRPTKGAAAKGKAGTAGGKQRPNAEPVVAAESQVPALVDKFYDALGANPDPSQPGALVQDYWATIFQQTLVEEKLAEVYKAKYPNDDLFRASLADTLKTVTTNTVVDSTRIQSLLINPETNVVKNGSSDASVFTIRADMLEEGFYIRQVRDEDTGQTRPVVEFE